MRPGLDSAEVRQELIDAGALRPVPSVTPVVSLATVLMDDAGHIDAARQIFNSARHRAATIAIDEAVSPVLRAELTRLLARHSRPEQLP